MLDTACEVSYTKGMEFTIRHSGYTSEVRTVAGLRGFDAASRDLIGMGFTCDRQAYDADDNVIGAYYHHKKNTHWTVEIVAEPTSE